MLLTNSYYFKKIPLAAQVLMSAWSNSAGIPGTNKEWDPTDTSQPTWADRFGNTITTGLFGYGTGTVDVPGPKIMPNFNISNQLKFIGRNTNYINDIADCFLEFQNASGVNRLTIKVSKPSNFVMRMEYGTTTANNIAASVGTYPQVGGVLTFTNSQLTFTRDLQPSDNYISDFTYACNMSDVTQIKMSGAKAVATNPAAGNAYIILSLLNP